MTMSIFRIAALATALAPVYPLFAIPTQIRFTVPFAFMAGDQKLPAGEYRITMDDMQPFTRVDGSNGQHFFLPRGIPTTPRNATTAKVIFNRYSEKFFLHEITRPGANGLELPPSKAERETAKGATREEVVFTGQ